MTNVRKSFVVLFLTISVQTLFITKIQAQATDEMVVRQQERLLFKAAKVTSPQQEVLDVIGLGLPIFAVSNVADGSLESYSHILRVTYPLQIGGGRTGFQLIFYGLNDKIPYAVAQEGNITSVYVPYSVHDQLKGKIEQTLAARRKVQLKINLLPSGLREAIWVIN
ncbi:MAG: hypothetical protein KGO80_00525 [Bacteroidetes bacterium]|nr:hypothetical protein [Bacteroidota bacterium]